MKIADLQMALRKFDPETKVTFKQDGNFLNIEELELTSSTFIITADEDGNDFKKAKLEQYEPELFIKLI